MNNTPPPPPPPPTLKNQSFLLTHNGKTITDLEFDLEGRPSLGPAFNPAQVQVFLAVMTLLAGEYPPRTSDLILDIRSVPRPSAPAPERLKEV